MNKIPNGAVEVIPIPSGLLARRLRSSLWCQKQAGIPHRGRSRIISRFATGGNMMGSSSISKGKSAPKALNESLFCKVRPAGFHRPASQGDFPSPGRSGSERIIGGQDRKSGGVQARRVVRKKRQCEQTGRGNPYAPSRLMLRLVPRLHPPRPRSGAPHRGRSEKILVCV